MRYSDGLVEFVKDRESFSAEPYLCPAGKWTNGYGNTHGVTEHTPPASQEQAEADLRHNLSAVCRAVEDLVKVPTNQNQADALISLCYNIGEGNFGGSSLLRDLNIGMYYAASQEFIKWVYGTNPETGKKEILPGLVSRRKAEQALFLQPINT